MWTYSYVEIDRKGTMPRHPNKGTPTASGSVTDQGWLASTLGQTRESSAETVTMLQPLHLSQISCRLKSS